MTQYFDKFEQFLSHMKKLDISRVFSMDVSFHEFIQLKLINSFASGEASDSVQVMTIVENSCVSAQAVSKSLRALENKNYIERFQSKSDRRVNEVKLTDYGKQVLNKSQEEMDELFSHVFSLFTQTELEIFEKLNSKFFEHCGNSLERFAKK